MSVVYAAACYFLFNLGTTNSDGGGGEDHLLPHTAASNTPREVLLGSATHTERERVTNTHIVLMVGELYTQSILYYTTRTSLIDIL